MRSHLLFDLDGTLVDSARDITRALNVILRERRGEEVDIAMVRPLVSLGADVLVKQTLGSHSSDTVGDLALFRSILCALAPDPTAIYPGVLAALMELKAAGHRLAIVTNKPQAPTMALLKGLELTSFFSAVVAGDTVERCKPHPMPVLHALDRIGGLSEHALFIGDSNIDAAAARACAIPFLLFEDGYGAADCADIDVWARFGRFDALKALIDGLADPAQRLEPVQQPRIAA